MQSAPTYEQLPSSARRHLADADSELIYAPYSTATWRLIRASGAVLYLKAAPSGLYPTLDGERARCLWLAARGAPVPEVIDFGQADGVEWLLTAGLAGLPATAPEHLADPGRTVPLLAEGLRAFHEIDPTGCPFDHTASAMVAHAAARVATGDVDSGMFEASFQHLDAAEALAQVRATVPATEDLVITHGDYCFPNALIVDGGVAGYLDLGEAGVADRWRDLAIATWSATWNVGPGFEELFLQAYGVALDAERCQFFRLLYELES